MEEFTIYHIPGIKIGVTSNLIRRMKDQGFTEWEVLEVHTDVYEVSDREQELQRQYGLRVDTVPYHIIYFRNRSEQQSNKLSAAGMGNTRNLGNIHSEETKTKMSAAQTGKVLSEETKDKMRVPKSEETKAKMRTSQKGKPKSKEHKANMSAAQTGKVLSEETKNKLRAKVQCPHCERLIGISNISRHIAARH